MTNKVKYAVVEGNPTREERLKALVEGKIIQVDTEARTLYHRLDKYHRMTFSHSKKEDSFHPYSDGFNYEVVLDDKDRASNEVKTIRILG